jgi:hypothetical protein
MNTCIGVHAWLQVGQEGRDIAGPQAGPYHCGVAYQLLRAGPAEAGWWVSNSSFLHFAADVGLLQYKATIDGATEGRRNHRVNPFQLACSS